MNALQLELPKELVTDLELIKSQLQELKKHFEPKTPVEFLTRQEVAKLLSVDLSTIHNYKKRNILKAYQIGGRVYYKRTEVENAVVELKN